MTMQMCLSKVILCGQSFRVTVYKPVNILYINSLCRGTNIRDAKTSTNPSGAPTHSALNFCSFSAVTQSSVKSSSP